VGLDEPLQPGHCRGHGDATQDGATKPAGEEQGSRCDAGERCAGGWRAEIAEADVRAWRGDDDASPFQADERDEEADAAGDGAL